MGLLTVGFWVKSESCIKFRCSVGVERSFLEFFFLSFEVMSWEGYAFRVYVMFRLRVLGLSIGNT